MSQRKNRSVGQPAARHARKHRISEETTMQFRISGLPAEPFQHLFTLDDAALKQHGAVRRVAENSGYPCRVSLTDAKTGSPVTGIYIYIWLPDGNFRSELTDATGTVRFDGLAKGTYKVRTPTGMLIDGNNEAGIDGQKDEQVSVTGKLVNLDRRIPVRRTTAIRAPIPKPYGAPPARRRTV